MAELPKLPEEQTHAPQTSLLALIERLQERVTILESRAEHVHKAPRSGPEKQGHPGCSYDSPGRSWTSIHPSCTLIHLNGGKTPARFCPVAGRIAVENDGPPA